MKTLREINPEAAEMWAYDLNGNMTPDNVGGSSEKIAYFRCLDNPKHLFSKKICKMTSNRDGHNIGCKYCGSNAKEAFPGETDFFTKVPEAVDMWDFSQNTDLGLEPTKLLPYSDKKAHFVCSNGHDEFRRISNFTKSPKCQTCLKSLLISVPRTQIFLNKKLNTIETIKDYINSDSRIIELACPNCHYTWSWQADLWRQRQYCPHCGYDGTDGSCERHSFVKEMFRIVTLRDANPEMAEIWDYDKNGEATPDNTRGQSNNKYAFKCKNGHAFEIELPNLYDKESGTPVGCPFCKSGTKKVLEGTNDLATLVPEILDFWDFDNNDVLPTTLSKGSGYEANFKCKNGHAFKRKVYHFSSDPRCPECRKSEEAQKNNIKNLRPESYRFWDFEKNTLDPAVTSIYLQEDAFWKCPDCGYEWIQKISSRCTAREGKCPSHDMKRRFSEDCGLKYSDSFAYKNPAAAKFWNQELNNGTLPENMPKFSTKEIYMNCSRGRHKPYLVRVCDINKSPYRCPECVKEDKEKMHQKYSLVQNVPCAADMWDYENNDIKLEDAKIYMRAVVNFICREGHHFSRGIQGFVNNQDCPICGMDTVAKYPHMVKQWNFKKNAEYDINLTSANLKKSVWWRCKKCGYEWQAQIFSRKQGAGHCPCCEERVVVVKGITDLFTIVPAIKELYDFEANTDINPDELSVTSLTRVNWRCKKCGYKWRTGVSTRVVLKNGEYSVKECPSCIGQVRTKSYGEEYPDLAVRFADELNHCSLYDLVEVKYASKHYYWHCDRCGELFESAINTMIKAVNSEFKGCSYCAGKKVVREKSFGYLHPEAMDEFDPQNEIDAYSVTEKSSKYAKWICRNNPEHRWEATFYARATGEGGCNICRGYHYGKMLYTEHQDFEVYYDTEKNVRPFKSYSNSSNKYVWWKCDKNHSFRWSIINFSRGNAFKCPICENRQLQVGENDLKSQYPELAQEFDSIKNNILPEQILFTNNDETMWWCCKEGHRFQRSIWYRVNHVRECPICNRAIIVKGINDFQTKYPKVTNIWDYEENDKTPDSISDKNNDKYSFRCKKGHQYEALLSTEKRNHFKCLVCSNKIIQRGTNSLSDTDEQLAKEFSPNEIRKPYEFHKYSKYYALWECSKCHGEYTYSIRDRKVGDDSCPYCSNRRVLAGLNSLADTDEELGKEWSENNELKATQVFRNSSNYALWNCPKCHGEYSYSIRDRKVGDDSCPYCSNRRVLAGLNSLADTDEELGKEWSENNELKATQVFRNSSNYALWNCPKCHGEYSYSIRDRVVGDDSCPYCSNRRVLAGLNSLADVDENLAKEWSMNNEKLPIQYLKTSSHSVLWNCPVCHGEYLYPIRNREAGDKSCPYCQNKQLLYGFNGVAQTEPLVIAEWADASIDPSGIMATSYIRVDWKCKKCGGVYNESLNKHIQDFYKDINNCPYCNDRRVLPGYNSLQVKSPNLMNEWDYKNNYLIVNPDNILPSYSNDVWWTCACGKNYKMSPKKRAYYLKRHMKACPYCKGRRRKKYRYF